MKRPEEKKKNKGKNIISKTIITLSVGSTCRIYFAARCPKCWTPRGDWLNIFQLNTWHAIFLARESPAR